MRTFIRTPNHRQDDENPYWISFSDLMSALLVVFLLTAIALIIELSEKKDLIDQEINRLILAQTAQKQILEQVKDELKSMGIEVEIDENKMILRIPNETLEFDSGSAAMPKEQDERDRVRVIGEVFYRVLNSELDLGDPKTELKSKREYLDTIFIEGHTDSQSADKLTDGNWGLSAETDRNWGLSTARAISLWDFWEKNTEVDPHFSALENRYGEKLFSVSGYADTRRLVQNDFDEERRNRNRRIDIRITIVRPTVKELQRVIDK